MSLLQGFRVALVAAIALMVFSCKSNNENESKENAYNFDTIHLENKSHLFNDTTKAKAIIEVNILVPKITTAKSEMALIEYCFKTTLFGKNDPELDLKSLSSAYVANYLKEYKQLEAIYLKDQIEFSKKMNGSKAENDLYEPLETAYNYEHRTDMLIQYNSKELLSYSIQRFDYTGGAHGMTTDSCFTILMKEGRILKQSDLFEDQVLDNVSVLITNQLANDNNEKDPMKLEEQGFFSVKEIFPNNNIYASDKGVTWIYNPYEIAAYALGVIKVTIPYEDLKPYLKPNNPLNSFIKK